MAGSMWNALSDRDYYGDSEQEERDSYGNGEDRDSYLDSLTEDDISLFACDPQGGDQ